MNSVAGAQPSESFCLLIIPGMADAAPRQEEMRLTPLGSDAPSLNEEHPIPQSGIPASCFRASVSWK